MTPDAARLAEIRGSLEAIEPGVWTRAADGEGEFVEARGEMGELLPVARFHPGATREEMEFVVGAPAAVRFLIGLVDRARARMREIDAGASGVVRQAHHEGHRGRSAGSGAGSTGSSHGELVEPRTKDFAAEASMNCKKPAFKLFLHERHGLEKPLTTERAAQKLRSLLGVASRRELNAGGDALARWRQVRADFREWRR